MNVHFLNCFTCNARVPARLRTGTLCLLVEADRLPDLSETFHAVTVARRFPNPLLPALLDAGRAAPPQS